MNNQIIGMYPGSFDPITNGHLDIIIRSLKIVNKLIVAVANNDSKKTLFRSDERKLMIQNEIIKIDKNLAKKIKILKFNGLLTDFAKKNNVTCIIRGLRALSDFEYEFQMTGMNARLESSIETVFLMSSENQQFISSRLVKEVFNFNGDISSFVSPNVLRHMKDKI